jgi:hypothetical protein
MGAPFLQGYFVRERKKVVRTSFFREMALGVEAMEIRYVFVIIEAIRL